MLNYQRVIYVINGWLSKFHVWVSGVVNLWSIMGQPELQVCYWKLQSCLACGCHVALKVSELQSWISWILNEFRISCHSELNKTPENHWPLADRSFHMFSRPQLMAGSRNSQFSHWLIHDQYESCLAPIQQALLVDDHINIYIYILYIIHIHKT